MASISGKDIILYDLWPGFVNPNMSKPTNGFDSTKEGSGNCVTAPLFRPGQKIVAYNDATKNSGWYTMVYLMFVETSDFAFDIDTDYSTAYGLCTHLIDASEHVPDGATDWWIVTNDATNSCATIGGALAVPMCELSGGVDITNAGRYPEYGWFWCGGVCPCNTSTGGLTEYTKTGAAFPTDGSVAAGKPFTIGDDGTISVGLVGWDNSEAVGLVNGFALVADA